MASSSSSFPSLSSSSNPSSSSPPPETTLSDLDSDSLVNCLKYLELQDVSNLAMTSKYFKSPAYSDTVWTDLFRKRWPEFSCPVPKSEVREAYFSKYIGCQQLKNDYYAFEYLSFQNSRSHQGILIDKDNDKVFVSQDSAIREMKPSDPKFCNQILQGHEKMVTCMRLIPKHETYLFTSGQRKDKVLVTSSRDGTVRFWWDGMSHRCHKGHTGPVTVLADKPLGDFGEKLLASGGEDTNICLWSLTANGKRGKNGQQALKQTYYGHKKPIVALSVCGDNSSLLVSISKDSMMKVWDTTPTTGRCLGTLSLPTIQHVGEKRPEPIDVKCHESVIYVAHGGYVSAIDHRKMEKVLTCAFQPQKIYSFEMLPSEFLLCTGGRDKAMLWDTRKSSNTYILEPVTEYKHKGRISHLHMDKYKVVTGSPTSLDINIWEPNTGRLVNSIEAYADDMMDIPVKFSAMAVNGAKIVTASTCNGRGCICYRDYDKDSFLCSTADDETCIIE